MAGNTTCGTRAATISAIPSLEPIQEDLEGEIPDDTFGVGFRARTIDTYGTTSSTAKGLRT